MVRKQLIKLFSAVVILAFASAVLATPAFADEAPPADHVVDIPTEASADTSSEEAASESTAEEVSPVEELLASIPEGTELIVVDENGDPLPFASEEVEEAILFKDPIWCPTGVAPKPGIGGCSISFSSLSALVAAFTPPTHGTIWIEAGNDIGIAVVIDGATNWAGAANFNLTLQGGWVGGTSGSKAIIGSTVFDTPISIVNWNGVVTINDIVLNGAANPTYSGALTVKTKKNIMLSNVTVINTNSGFIVGAFLDNSASTAQASVTVKNSAFNNNTSWGGLYIASNGAVTLSNVNANNNKYYGIAIDNDNDSIASPVTVSNSSFNGSTNGGGLMIYSNGAVKLSQLTAGDNNGVGIYINNTIAPSAQPVTATGFINVTHNTGSGLEIYSKGAVTLANLTANHNTAGYGVCIENSTSAAPQPVTITGKNVFNNNYANGLYVQSKGAITVSNITAMYNGTAPASNKAGVFLFNDFDSTKPQNITISGNNYFQNNGHSGLTVHSYGAITVSNVTALNNGHAVNDNASSGMFLYNGGGSIAKPVTVKGTNVFNNNDGTGIEIISRGVITISNITAKSNDAYGAYLSNNGVGLSSNVVVSGINAFHSNLNTGLFIASRGAITVNNITATNNSNHGAELRNAYGVLQRPIIIAGYGVFDWNTNDGLNATSNGAITTKNLSAYNNNGNGVYLWTKGILAPQAVNMTGANSFISNGNVYGESGLIVNADGNITVSNITANYNFSSGAWLDNYTNWALGTFATFGSVTIKGFGKFNSNGRQGVYIETNGSATLNNVSANHNINDDGIGILAFGKVTLVCASANNNGWGVYLWANPTALTIKGLMAVGNTSTNEHFNSATPIRTRCP